MKIMIEKELIKKSKMLLDIVLLTNYLYMLTKQNIFFSESKR